MDDVRVDTIEVGYHGVGLFSGSVSFVVFVEDELQFGMEAISRDEVVMLNQDKSRTSKSWSSATFYARLTALIR